MIDSRMLRPENRPKSILCFLCVLCLFVACRSVIDRQDVRPRVLRDVPARNLAYRLTPDTSPPSTEVEDFDKFPAIANIFAAKRTDEALIRTVTSPDGRRVLALYGGADDPGSTFRIDLYNFDREFLATLISPS